MSGGIKDFGKRWFVTIVMVPSIAVVHMVWMKLQDVPTLVKPEEKQGFPHLAMFHKMHSAQHFDSRIRTFTHQPD